LAALGYGIGTVLLVIVASALYAAIERGQRSSSLADRTLQTLESIARIEAAMGQAESAQRGGFLYGKELFVAERDGAIERARTALGRLRSLNAESASERSRVAQLGRLIEERAMRMRDRLQARELAMKPSPRAWAGVGQAMTAHIYGLTAVMREAQLELLGEHKRRELAEYQAVGWILAVSALLLAVIIVPGYLAFLHETRAHRGSQRRIRDLADSLPGAVFQLRIWCDGRMKYELLSAGTRTVRGIDPAAALRDPRLILDTVYETDRAMFGETVARSVATMTPAQMDYRAVLPDGRLRWIRSVTAPSARRDGSVVLSGHWADVTVQKEMEATLLQALETAGAANLAKGQFVATISHEIRTPMHGMLAMLELLSLSSLDEEQARNLRIVRESGQSLLRIINDILDFSKIEAQKLDLAPEPASLGAIVERVANMYSCSASGKGLTLRRSVDEAIPPLLLFDPGRLQQILSNLVSNAIKFTSRGEVSVNARLVRCEGGEAVVQLQVNDTGIGMTLEEQQCVFDCFTQANREITGRYGGSGLGLSIARNLAKLMGGAIDMRSKQGSGTEMQVTLPMKVAQAKAVPDVAPGVVDPARRREPAATGTGGEEHLLVLIVDDHPVNCLVMLKQCNVLGYAAETAESAPEALEKLKSGRFAAVFTDCNMPDMTGYDLARAIRALEASGKVGRIPIIACTANALPGDLEKCIGAGMDDYLAKPADLAAVALKLERWLRAPPIDAEVLAKISAGDANAALDFLKQFRQYSDGDTASLRDAFRQGDAAELLAACHRIRGSTWTIGAAQLATACEEVERNGRAGDWSGVAAAMKAFDREVERLGTYIDGRTGKLNG
jgi:signal transduction histidine kinase/CheY-like chemotaxis protein/HPt (histidine-containing phosphotransfer) domain-containing protein